MLFIIWCIGMILMLIGMDNNSDLFTIGAVLTVPFVIQYCIIDRDK